MDWANFFATENVIGYLAGSFVFCTFYMKTMFPLRYMAIASNCVFIVYGLMLGLFPVFILHMLLLPLNITRLSQMKKLLKKIHSATDGNLELSDILFPFIKQKTFKKDSFVFRKEDPANEVYYIVSGTVKIVDIDKTVEAGELIGEMGVFSPFKTRTDSAFCETDVEIGVIAEDQFWNIYYQNPEFGSHLIQLVLKRMVENRNYYENRKK